MISHRRALGVALLSAAGVLAVLSCSGDEGGSSMFADFDMPDAMAKSILAENGCTNCHGRLAGHIPPVVGGPIFDGVLERAQRPWLEAFLTDPEAERGRCPDGLHGMSADERAQTAELLIHRFAYLSPEALKTGRTAINPARWNAQAGEELFHRVGCVSCHTDGLANRRLSQRFTWPALADFLEDPAQSRPHDLMPDMGLSAKEAGWIASWLLRDLESELERTGVAGLEVASYEFPQSPQSVADMQSLEPVRRGVAATIGVEPRTQEESFGLIFTGMLDVAESGRYELYCTSDDGSRVWLDGEQVIDNDGHHAPRRIAAELDLEAGSHSIRVEMFEASGGEELEVGFRIDGEDQPFTADMLWHGGVSLPDSSWAGFQVDADKAKRGAAASRSCLPCHRAANMPAPGGREWVADEGGCLSVEVPAGAPRFNFEDGMRDVLAAAARTAKLTQLNGKYAGRSLPDGIVAGPGERAEAWLRHFDCTSCHARFEVGGPSAAALEHFSGSEDLGEEGVRPPDLTGIGAKLTPRALREALTGELSVRPYMHTRMPAISASLAEHFASDLILADEGAFGAVPIGGDRAEPLPGREELIEAGRELVGTGGFACVSCHPVAGLRGPGIQGMDLAAIAGRLQPEWFRKWLLDPPAMRPGTRMPAFFPGGNSVQSEILGGDAEAQIAAMWEYLSLGENMPLPEGILVDSDAYQLVPIERPLYVGVFMEGMSARTTAVGFPERVNAAFDLHNVRLGKVWGGDFLDVAGTWDGRAGQLENPAAPADRVRALPSGPAVARLDSADALWPTETGKAAGWRMRSHVRDADGRPSWIYTWGDLVVEESLVPAFAGNGSRLIRRFRITNPGDAAATLRAWVGEGAEVTVRGATLRQRGAEQLVDIPAGAEGFEFEVEMNW